MPEEKTTIRSVHSADGAVLMDIDRGKLFSLNSTGSAIYELMAKGMSDDAIVEELARRFDISADAVKSDLKEFRSALRLHAIDPQPPALPE